MTLPRILVIDDQYFWDRAEKSVFLNRTNLPEIKLSTTDDDLMKLSGAGKIGGVVFCSGQRKSNGRVENSIDEVDKYLKAGWPSTAGWRWALVLLDLNFSSGMIVDGLLSGIPNPGDDAFGIQIMNHISKSYPEKDISGSKTGNSEIPVMILSGVREEVRKQKEPQANLHGALRYVTKTSLDQKLIRDLLFEDGLVEDERGIIIGKSLPVLKMLRQARQVTVKKRANILILGEQGTGKTELARYIHHNSGRVPYQEYTVNPANPQLQYSDLFGYWKGAFTGADQNVAGKAEKAHMGTLFVDEVGNLPELCQKELLQFGRLLSDDKRYVRRLGNHPNLQAAAPAGVIGDWEAQTGHIKVDVLLITATNSPLDDPAFRDAISFRNDLYDRLGKEYSLPIRVPSLIDCLEDVQHLFAYFLKKETEAINGVLPKNIHGGVIEKLEMHEWQSNIAELKGVANFTAWQTRHFSDVYPRHLPTLETDKRSGQRSNRDDIKSDTVIEQSTEMNRPTTSSMLESALFELLASYREKGLRGLLPKIRKAALFALKEALAKERNEHAPAIRTLLNKATLTGGSKGNETICAYTEINRIANFCSYSEIEDEALKEIFLKIKKRAETNEQFTKADFAEERLIESLWSVIRSDRYDIELPPGDTIDSLNFLLEIPMFYDAWSKRWGEVKPLLVNNFRSQYSRHISNTADARKMKHLDIKSTKMKGLVKLNRLILERTYDNLCPQKKRRSPGHE